MRWIMKSAAATSTTVKATAMSVVMTAAITGAGAVAAGPAAADDPQVLGGWFGNWHPPQTVATSMTAGKGRLTDSAIFAFAFGGAGNPVCAITEQNTCSVSAVASTSSLRQSLRAMKGTTRWVSHVDLSSTRARELSATLRDRAQRKRLIGLLVARTTAVGADGLDLDWENFAFNDGSDTWAATRPAFNRTVRQLAAALHAQGKKLSVTVPVGSNPYGSDGQPQRGSGYWVYDWAKLAASADRLNLMAYDYSWASPGPIGPNRWAKQAATAAVETVGAANARKVILGVPLYGKSWPTPGPNGQAVIGDCPSGWRPNSIPGPFSMTATQAAQFAADRGIKVEYRAGAGERTFTYPQTVSGTYSVTVGKGKRRHAVRRSTDCTVTRTVWYGDRLSLAKRAALAKSLGIGGVFAWNLASADAALFRRYAARMLSN